MDKDNVGVPIPVSTVVVRRQYYPRVPPELLLRDHAGKFHLSALTLASLLDAVSPRVKPVLPPFLARKENSGGANDDLVYTLIRENVKLPPVPSDNIKEPGPVAQRLKEEAQRRAAAASSSKAKKQLTAEDEGTFVFEEAAASHLTAVEFLRLPTQRVEDDQGAGQQGSEMKKTFPSLRGLVSSDLKLEEGECLWGYNTGAVLLVTLRVYATDLRNRRYYATLPLLAQRSYLDHEREVGGGSSFGSSVSLSTIAEEQRNNLLEYGISTEERDFIRSMSEQAPRGVSLLGYHPVGGVCSLVYDSHNDLAVSGGVDGTLFVWDVHQQYRGALREKYMHDDETRSMRPAQQFAAYVHTRRLTQRISRAHQTAVSALATHCELMISGGVDGTVKVWSCLGLRGITAHDAPPQYVEQQVFNCNGWVRHIWSSPERVVQGDDVLVTGEHGCIIGFKGTTFSQEPVVQPSQVEKRLLHALRKTAGHASDPAALVSRKGSTNRRGSMQFPTFIASRMSSSTHAGGLLKPATNEKEAMKLLHRGVITRALRTTRKLQTIGEEARLASLPGSQHSVRDESTSSITRIIPLLERNLFIVLGYSPTLRFLDMTRLSVAAVVMHPSLSVAAGEDKGGNAQAAAQGNLQGSGKGRLKHQNNANIQKKTFLISGNDAAAAPVAGGGAGEPLRFVDVLYVTSLDYLLLLDNRNMVFVWDNVENKFLASWRSPAINESGKPKTALRLLPCGTRHYYSSEASGGKRISAQTQGKAKRRVACFFGEAHDLTGGSRTDKGPSGAITVPFFVVCNTGLELCDVVIEAQTRLEFRAHKDTIVGIFLRESPLHSPLHLEKRPKTMSGASDAFEQIICRDPNNSTFNRMLTSTISSRKTARFATRCNSSNSVEEINVDPESEWFKNSLRATEDNGRIHVLSCSADGDICFWGSSFEPLSVYHHGNVSGKNSEFCTTIAHKPLQLDGVVSPFDAPPCKIRKSGVKPGVENDGSDVTAFYYNTRWNLAVTGHDDGSIRYWPCGKELATCVWHKGLHRNAVSGLVEARIVEQEGPFTTLTRLGSGVNSLIPREPNEFLASVSFDGHLAVWEYPAQSKAQPHGRTRISFNELLCVAFDEINELFIVGDSAGTVSSWHARGLEPLRSIPSRPPSPWRPSTTASALAAAVTRVNSPTSKVATRWPHSHRTSSSSSGSVATCCSDSAQQEQRKRVGHTEAVTALLVDGNFVFSGGEDGRVFLWDLRIGALLREYILLHDLEEIGEHRREVVSSTTTQNSSSHSRGINPRSTEGTSFRPGRMVRLYTENVTCFALLKRRNGDFLVATREGWMYHFEQSFPHPRSTYKHRFSVSCMCVLQDGCAEDDNTINDDESDFHLEEFFPFELVVGDDEGNVAVIRETHFISTV
ncbi:uncharacterized protein Tco025E_07645 [Trypanosoma conorhini]|uniref:Uncharacterized protein n=1 Tax=Trypanosoma conorhini TaxID=83891 RepID=A0A422NL64_9TRYP|nr:uncharacterized protein Tco025E_07645 [Trypanosoma conorhini]RNF06164.1 hypothetical protein Tco025E_07645 [Trypanosoma conorhini]